MNNYIKVSCLCLLSGAAVADVTPRSLGKDYRVQTVKYDVNNVYNVYARQGRSTLIKLENDENVLSKKSGIGLGDADAWSFGVKENNIFLKPISDNPSTNLIITTNKNRTYVFDIFTNRKSKMTYVLNFEYEKKYESKEALKPCNIKTTYNDKYYKWGDNELSPYKVWDNGIFTCFEFRGNKELPVIYKKGLDGEEILTNFTVFPEFNTVEVHSVNNEYRIRLGDKVLGVETNDSIIYNVNPTTNIDGYKREIKK